MKDIILYHGSKSGINGEISSSAGREKCDFGKGFYMGTDLLQAKSLVSKFDSPKIYTLRLKLSDIPESRILRLDDNKEWLYTVLACRGALTVNEMPSLKKFLSALKKCDIVIGKIADDSMSEAFNAFYENNLTDEGLIACLQKVDYGLQYVAKTDFACSKIEIVSEKRLIGREKQDATFYGVGIRHQCYQVVDDMQKKYSEKGKYMHNILAKEKSKGTER